jgi:hypothetical protein
MVSRDRNIAGISVSIVTFDEGTIWPILYFFMLNNLGVALRAGLSAARGACLNP